MAAKTAEGVSAASVSVSPECSLIVVGSLISLLATGRRPQWLMRWTSPQGCLNVFMTWQLTSPRVNNPRERQRKRARTHTHKATSSATFYSLDMSLSIVYHSKIVFTYWKDENLRMCRHILHPWQLIYNFNWTNTSFEKRHSNKFSFP